ncbi:hypothetical protein LC085_15455 [Bacillus tianshenii]|uniref:hypothetical protein n=1 Tax=Sutcliffiella tianshenii TaxID=1463404 RepID=UPI001CD62EF0|nr:hypothetical protein [Bacillus tianshenii]MCA1321318.1 hypothetical protein [Bacillus tianshenii]
MGDPTGEAEEAPIRPRGKQVSGAEINGLLLKRSCEFNKIKTPVVFGEKEDRCVLFRHCITTCIQL